MRVPMPIVAFSLTFLTAGPAAFAQNTPPGAPRTPAKKDSKLYPAATALPEPVDPESLKPTIVLPEDPIEPYLLTKDNGPFMVSAKTFKGPEAERYALALVLELRRDFGLPAYILRTKDFPMRSFMRNVPPTAPEYVRKPRLVDPERVRSTDEAVVLVGDEKTLADSVKLLDRVKKIKPQCLDKVPSMLPWRTGNGLHNATRTTNPFVPTQNLFPGRRKDNLLVTMNSGPHSILSCPGRYSLQVAEFTGRSLINPDQKDPKLLDPSTLKSSPLMTAMDDAERMAQKLAKDPEIAKTGYQPYVYHGRTSSQVLVGSFNSPTDPAAARLRDTLVRNATAIQGKKGTGPMIAPALQLTDLENPARPIKQ